MMTDQFRRAVLAFPDEDVLIGTRFIDPVRLPGLHAPRGHRPPPRPQGHRRGAGLGPAPGQALRRRERRIRRPDLRGHAATARPPLVFDHESLKPETLDPDVVAFFDAVDSPGATRSIAFGWAMAEDLEKLL